MAASNNRQIVDQYVRAMTEDDEDVSKLEGVARRDLRAVGLQQLATHQRQKRPRQSYAAGWSDQARQGRALERAADD